LKPRFAIPQPVFKPASLRLGAAPGMTSRLVMGRLGAICHGKSAG
jgi:hypothetical protein